MVSGKFLVGGLRVWEGGRDGYVTDTCQAFSRDLQASTLWLCRQCH